MRWAQKSVNIFRVDGNFRDTVYSYSYRRATVSFIFPLELINIYRYIYIFFFKYPSNENKFATSLSAQFRSLPNHGCSGFHRVQEIVFLSATASAMFFFINNIIYIYGFTRIIRGLNVPVENRFKPYTLREYMEFFL